MKAFLPVLWSSASFFAQAVLARSGSRSPTEADLVGTWQLLSIEDTIAGEVRPAVGLGPHAAGVLMYQAEGYMCATLVDGHRPAWTDPAKPTDAEKIACFDTFIAYCGTYKVDCEKSVVYHYPTIAWSPAFVGTTQARPFRLEGDKLIITVSENLDYPGMERRVLTWKRARRITQSSPAFVHRSNAEK